MKETRGGSQGFQNRTVRIALIGTLAVLLAALTLVLILTDWFAPGPDPAIPHVTVPNSEELRAKRYELTAEGDAQAYFERLLASGYIGLDGDLSVSAEWTDGKWRMRAEAGNGTQASAVFDREGVITSLSVGMQEGGAMKNAKTPYTLSNGGSEIIEYARAFVYEYLPDIMIVSGRVASDRTDGTRRIVTCETANRFADPAHEFTMQVQPELRIVGFRLLVDEDKGLVRVSRSADSQNGAEEEPDAAPAPAPDSQPLTEKAMVEIARSAISAAYDIPRSEVDTYDFVSANRYEARYTWCGFTPEVPYRVVSFRLPGSDDRVISDYDVLMDAATGEVLYILDPSNNSNG